MIGGEASTQFSHFFVKLPAGELPCCRNLYVDMSAGTRLRSVLVFCVGVVQFSLVESMLLLKLSIFSMFLVTKVLNVS